MKKEEEKEGAEEQQRFSYMIEAEGNSHFTMACLCEENASDKEVQLSEQTITVISEVRCFVFFF